MQATAVTKRKKEGLKYTIAWWPSFMGPSPRVKRGTMEQVFEERRKHEGEKKRSHRHCQPGDWFHLGGSTQGGSSRYKKNYKRCTKVMEGGGGKPVLASYHQGVKKLEVGGRRGPRLKESV